ncbi:MAG: hypothetical protein KatS3mg031_2295 [Chitinophagales bacterium]|nr:MAG: hypothetical protein KatS3mg031_2295 [Chitinophagales bacterium]
MQKKENFIHIREKHYAGCIKEAFISSFDGAWMKSVYDTL